MAQGDRRSAIRWIRRLAVALIALPLISILIFISLLIHALTPLPDPRFDIVGEVEKLIEDGRCLEARHALSLPLNIPDATITDAMVKVARHSACHTSPENAEIWANITISHRLFSTSHHENFDWYDADFTFLRQQLALFNPRHERLSWDKETARAMFLGDYRDWLADGDTTTGRLHFPRDHWVPGWFGRIAMRDIIYDTLGRPYRWGRLEGASIRKHFEAWKTILTIARCEVVFDLSTSHSFYVNGLALSKIIDKSPHPSLSAEQVNAWEERIAECKYLQVEEPENSDTEQD